MKMKALDYLEKSYLKRLKECLWENHQRNALYVLILTIEVHTFFWLPI